MEPSYVEWYFTNKCYLNCIHCMNNASIINYNEAFDNLTFICNELIKIKPTTINISGGDPLIEPNIYNIANMFLKNNINLTLSTTGFKIDKDSILNILKFFPGGIQLSIDSFNSEVHDKIRGRKGALHNCIKTIKLIRKYSLEYDIQVCMVLNKLNVNDIKNTIKLASELKVNSIKILSLYPIGRSKQNKYLFLDKNDMNKPLEDIVDAKNKYTNINIFYRDPIWQLNRHIIKPNKNYMMTIMNNGDIKIATYLPFCFGNVYKDNLSSIWNYKMENFFTTEAFKKYFNNINTVFDIKDKDDLIWI